MRSIGNIIKEARTRKKLSIQRLSAKTKIKANYILALEQEQFDLLPSLSVAQGFVKSLATSVGVDSEMAAAFLRRDFVARKETKTTLPQALWNPKNTVVLLSIITFGFLGFYLFHQYQVYVAPPPLSINEIKKDGGSVFVSGKTNENAQVLVGDEAVLVNDNGTFEVTVNAKSGDKLTIQALSRSGKATKKEIMIP